MSLEETVREIQERNKRVELDKAWEVSLTRRGFIAAVTYLFASAWLYSINNPRPFLNAAIPVVGYLLSTLALPFLKRWWSRKFY